MWEGLIGTDTNALILVIDSSDRERMPVVKEELNKLLAMESLSKACLLLFANKQDLPDCMAPMEIVQELGLEESKRPFHIQGCSVINDNDGGLQAGIAWIASQLKH
jgi:ADP-ribosylation factor-like protein 5B